MRFFWILSLAACAWGQPAQPIPFSHKTHIGEVKLTCADCHAGPAKFGDAVGIPDAPKCLECHADLDKRQPIPWVRISCQPCHVKTGARTACNTCHDPR